MHEQDGVARFQNPIGERKNAEAGNIAIGSFDQVDRCKPSVATDTIPQAVVCSKMTVCVSFNRRLSRRPVALRTTFAECDGGIDG
jgi:hypothetical protein